MSKLTAQLINAKTNTTLGSTAIDFAGGNWTMLNFSITTTAGTTCVDGTKDPSVKCGKMGPASHICVSCAGQFHTGGAVARAPKVGLRAGISRATSPGETVG